jgi:hypothetical protein
MRLLEPYFLYAFLALAIPIIIHLFSFQKHKIVHFSNVAFLKQIRQKKSNITKLQKLLLLLTRLLLISAIILAFSEPYISNNEEAIENKKIIGIYIDNSFSMNAENEKGRLIDQAKNHARNVLNAHQETDEFIFLSNELKGKHQRILDYNNCLEAIDQTSIEATVLEINTVINRWNTLKQNEINTKCELFIISDFQKTSFKEEFYLKDKGFTTHLIPISSYPQANIAIDTCYLESPNHTLGGQEWLNFDVSNASNNDLDNITVKLFINGKQKALSTLSIKAQEKTSSKLSFNNHSIGTQEAYIEIKDPIIPFDNKLYFNFNVKASNKVLCIYEEHENKSLFALFQDNIFEYLSYKAGKLDLSKLNQQNLIILDGITHPTSGLINELKVYTDNGGSLLIIPSDKIHREAYKNLALKLNIPEYSEYHSRNLKVAKLNTNHSIFKDVFEKQTKDTDLPDVKQYYSLKNTHFNSEEQIMSLNTNEPFISSYINGLGSIYLLCSPLKKKATNLEKHALFVPLLHNMGIHNASVENIYYTLGKTKTIELQNQSSIKQWRIQKEGTVDLLPEVKTIDQKIYINLQELIHEDGFYTLTNKDENKIISFNYNRLESNLTTWETEELEKINTQYTHIKLWKKEGLQLENSLKENRSGSNLWHIFILFSLMLLITESLLLKNWKNKTHIELDVK